jgi:hypothetical protein
MRDYLVSAAVFLAALLGGAEAQERAVPQSAAQVQLSFAPVVSNVAAGGGERVLAPWW